MGLAAKLYSDFEGSCAHDSGRLVCEVNMRPANEGSMLFHKREGFEQIGAQETEGGVKQVALMLKELG
jgi:predicted GNAT superfamily acetyltransferase